MMESYLQVKLISQAADLLHIVINENYGVTKLRERNKKLDRLLCELWTLQSDIQLDRI